MLWCLTSMIRRVGGRAGEGLHGKGWGRAGEGPEKGWGGAGEGLGKAWRRAGEGLEKGWERLGKGWVKAEEGLKKGYFFNRSPVENMLAIH